ncbi:MAG: beta-galactosidase [Clostridia bacterium]|nr:beta-galactosidase [Clostridia bacterium]
MFNIRNGILYRNGRRQIVLGQSYYPSFHEKKYPVPPDGDRYGIMRSDMRAMREAGFNFVRMAALGELKRDAQGNVSVRTPFIDDCVRECIGQDMVPSIRLQGYVMNLSGHSDWMMRNEKDQDMEQNWSAFIRNSLFHKGILRDNEDASQALTRHFMALSVHSFQIYNEPHYAYNGIFDYHPAALKAYAAWQKRRGQTPEPPPREIPRPGDKEGTRQWADWRIFSTEAMSRFLNGTARAVHEAGGENTYTCFTAAAVSDTVTLSGVDYFAVAEKMDILGITSYIHLEGADYYAAKYQYDLAESAAALYGKHAWIIECDGRYHMPGRKSREEVYALLGSGFKGIVFYEWRGDYPDAGTPFPDNCGFIDHSGKPAGHYKDSLRMLAFVNRWSEMLAGCEKAREGVGILYSLHALAMGDTVQRGGVHPVQRQCLRCYRDIKRAGITPSFLQAKHLKKNPQRIRTLFVPCVQEYLSKEEHAQIDAFVRDSGNVFFVRPTGTFGAASEGWWPWNEPELNRTTSEFRSGLETADALRLAKEKPLLTLSCPRLSAGILEDEQRYIVLINNIDPLREAVDGAFITGDIFCRAKIQYADEFGETALFPQENRVDLPLIDAGGMMIIQKPV